MNIVSTMLLVVVFLALLSGFYMLWRNHQVYKMRMRLLNEESAWLELHTMRLLERGYHFDGFRRYDTLPTYNRMFYTFWKSLPSYEKELKPINEYYTTAAS